MVEIEIKAKDIAEGDIVLPTEWKVTQVKLGPEKVSALGEKGEHLFSLHRLHDDKVTVRREEGQG